MRKFLLIWALISMIATTSFAKEKADDNRYEIEMAEVGEPGTLVVKVWCYNKKPQISEDVAKMNAIKGVLFKGVSDSGRMKGRKALVEDGYENHKDYFDDFFNEGKYANYSRVALNNYVEQNSLVKVGKLYKIGKIVVISYNDLRKQLETDKVIKGLNYGF
jgi:hypothetical protein